MVVDADLQASSPLIVSLSIRFTSNGLSTLKNVSENKGLKFCSARYLDFGIFGAVDYNSCFFHTYDVFFRLTLSRQKRQIGTAILSAENHWHKFCKKYIELSAT